MLDSSNEAVTDTDVVAEREGQTHHERPVIVLTMLAVMLLS